MKTLLHLLLSIAFLSAMLASTTLISEARFDDSCPVIVNPACGSSPDGSLCMGGGTLETRLRKNAPATKLVNPGDTADLGIFQSVKTSKDGSALLRLANGAAILAFGGAEIVDQRTIAYTPPPDPNAPPFTIKAQTWFAGTIVKETPDLVGKQVAKLDKGVTVTVDGRTGDGPQAYAHIIMPDGKPGWLEVSLLSTANAKSLDKSPDFAKLPIKDAGAILDLTLASPFETFHLNNDASPCSGILMTAPKRVMLSLNRLRIRFDGLVYITAKPSDQITIVALQKDTLVTALIPAPKSGASSSSTVFGRAPSLKWPTALPECVIPVGAIIRAPLDDRGRVNGGWSALAPYSPDQVGKLPIKGFIGNPGLPAPYNPGNPDNSPSPSGGGGASTPPNTMTPGLWGLNLYYWVGCPGPDFGTFLTFNADPQKLIDAWQSGFAVGVAQAATPDITWSYENPSPGVHRFHAALPSGKELAIQFVWVAYDYFDVWAAADTCEGYGYLIFFG